MERDEIGRETRYAYDTFGNVIAVTAPDGSRTQIDYHETLNLPVAVNDPAGRMTGYAYDGRGNLTAVTDPAGHSTRYGYNEQWLPDTVTDASGKTKRLQYDALGHTTRHHYDEAGNHIRTDYPDGSAEHFEYDRLNRLIAHTDGLGAKTAYELAADS